MTGVMITPTDNTVKISKGKKLLKLCKWFLLTLLTLIFLYALFVRPWTFTWGASPTEIEQTLPGDDLVNNPIINTTRVITINTASERIWPWLVQVGLNRGGWYSYDRIEKALGAGDFYDGHSAERIIPELQNLKVGDRIEIAPRNGLNVSELVPNQVIVLHERVEDPFINWTWVYYLEKIDNQQTRLIIRTRIESGADSIGALIGTHVVMEPGSFIMERKMLKGIKSRAEVTHPSDKVIIR